MKNFLPESEEYQFSVREPLQNCGSAIIALKFRHLVQFSTCTILIYNYFPSVRDTACRLLKDFTC